MAPPSYLTNILNKNSTEKYYIEFKGFLSNHLAHGVVALHHLSVDEERINRFVDWYTPTLESPASYNTEDPDCEFESLLGKRKSYYRVLQYYEDLLKNKYKTLDKLVSAEYPKLSDGISGAALHGTIHLGYGFSVQNERVVLEGLAYIYHSHRPLVTSEPTSWKDEFGKGQVDIVDALSAFAGDQSIQQAIAEGMENESWMSEVNGPFQKRLFYMLTIKGDTLVNCVKSFKIPRGILTDQGEIDAHALAKKVVYWAIVVYTLSSKKNDFFLLHGVTCAWSLTQILPVLDESAKVKVICEFLAILVGVYIAEGAPPLTVPVEEQSDSWEDLVETALKEDRDEHCYKLLQVCHELARGQAADEDPNLLKQAAASSWLNEFHFRR